jgi:hypothetical protein
MKNSRFYADVKNYTTLSERNALKVNKNVSKKQKYGQVPIILFFGGFNFFAGSILSRKHLDVF